MRNQNYYSARAVFTMFSYINSPGLLRCVIARAHLHTLHVLLRCAINTRLAKILPYYAHLEKLFVRRKNYSVSYFSIIKLNKVIKVK